jgi:acetoin utilization protein AcuB
MLVNALMLGKEKLITASPEENLKSALKKMEDNGFLSIPVVEGKKLAGIISKEKIYEEFFKGNLSERENFLENVRVKGIYCGVIPKVDPVDPIERAARVLETFGIPFVAVVNEREEFLGIVTHYAIFHTFGEIFGINEGRRIEVTAYDIPGQLAKLTDIVAKSGGDIISLTVLGPNVKLDVKEIVLRVRVANYDHLISRIKEAGFKVQ